MDDIANLTKTIDQFTGNIIEEIQMKDGRRFRRIRNRDGEVIDVEAVSEPLWGNSLTDGLNIHSGYSQRYGNLTTWISQEDANKIYNWKDILKKAESEEEAKVNIQERKEDDITCSVFCKDENDLSIERILTTISAVKGRLQLLIAPIHIREIECYMTPETKKNIVTASKKLSMYGKKLPIIARFDEYGNRLPDEIKIGDNAQGITLNIIDPKEKGSDLYFELKAIEFPPIFYKPR